MQEQDKKCNDNKEVMIGTWAWGPGYNGSRLIFGKSYDESMLRDTFEKATKLGFLKWDTAAVYGMGSCEKLLGEFINGREDIFLSTKTYADYSEVFCDIENIEDLSESTRIILKEARNKIAKYYEA